MNNYDTIDLLNELLAEESRSLLPRLFESTVFVSWASADDQFDVNKMATVAQSHRQWLVNAISDLGGDPAPVWGDIRSTSVHFVELESVLPRTLADEKQLLRIFETASAAVGNNERAAQVVSQIIDSRRRLIDTLTRLCDLAASKPA